MTEDTPQRGLDAWRKAQAAYRKRQRTERARGCRPRRGLGTVSGPGMIRARPPEDDTEDTDTEQETAPQ